MIPQRAFHFNSCRAFFAPKSETSNSISATTPLSPTNYQQPPTPDHPPPSAQTAERMILERIRPLSQVGDDADRERNELPKIIVTHTVINVFDKNNCSERHVFETDV